MYLSSWQRKKMEWERRDGRLTWAVAERGGGRGRKEGEDEGGRQEEEEEEKAISMGGGGAPAILLHPSEMINIWVLTVG